MIGHRSQAQKTHIHALLDKLNASNKENEPSICTGNDHTSFSHKHCTQTIARLETRYETCLKDYQRRLHNSEQAVKRLRKSFKALNLELQSTKEEWQNALACAKEPESIIQLKKQKHRLQKHVWELKKNAKSLISCLKVFKIKENGVITELMRNTVQDLVADGLPV